MSNPTYPEVIVHVACKDSVIIIWSLQVWRLLVCLLSKLFLELLLVADHHFLAFGLQQGDERMDDLQGAAPKWSKNKDLIRVIVLA